MPLTAAQIVALACQDAKVPGYTAQAGATLNLILQDLCQDYDFDIAKKTIQVPLVGSFGPYVLPADYLRVPKKGAYYTISGVPYFPEPLSFDEYNILTQQNTLNGYPTVFATDMSQSPPLLYVWPLGNGVTMTLRYCSLMPDIATPETSAVVPWFPNTNYLRTRLAAELMKITDDSRIGAFMGDAAATLDRYLKMKDDNTNRATTVQLDTRRFGVDGGRLRNTKTIGW